jgi:hypothetical protein
MTENMVLTAPACSGRDSLPLTGDFTAPQPAQHANSAPPAALPLAKPESTQAGAAAKQKVSGGLQQIGQLVKSVAIHLKQAVGKIERINLQMKILSFNAQIESVRAGEIGNAFAVVAKEMVNLSVQTTEVTDKLATETDGSVHSLNQIIAALGQEIRGTRLADLAMTNIDVIDRNLYERSCDVRWWATDGSAVDALTGDSPAARERACERLGVILDSYTVYYDIVLCDLEGRVVANGRKRKYPSIGTSQKETEWFQSAIKTKDGTQFGFQSVHHSSTLANGEHILVYSCGVRRNGDAKGELLGVLGIVFNWEALGQTVACGTLLSESEKRRTRVCIVDRKGLVLADSEKLIIAETLSLPDQAALFAAKKHHIAAEYKGVPSIIAHALSPGFETYATGWHSLIIQELELD